MPIKTIPAAEAVRLVAAGARLVDIRPPDEYSRSHATGAINLPVDSLQPIAGEEQIVFLCRTGMRTAANSARLEAASGGRGLCLEGGLDAWRAAGLPVSDDHDAPLEIMRQVQIAAGTLVLAGVILGLTVAPGWFALAGFVGAGLAFAGISGWCGMASLLAVMPWNRRAAR